MSSIFLTQVLRDDGKDGEVEIPVQVEYAYHGAIRGQRDSICGVRGAGPPLEPDEPAHIEVDRVFTINQDGTRGSNLELTNGERESIEEEIMRDIADRGFDRED